MTKQPDWWEPEVAQRRDFKINLATTLVQWVRASGASQVEMAARLGISQPRLSNLMRGMVHRFSIDNLLELLLRAGYRLGQTLEVAGPPVLRLTIKPDAE